jgi:hypothetical protein
MICAFARKIALALEQTQVTFDDDLPFQPQDIVRRDRPVKAFER